MEPALALLNQLVSKGIKLSIAGDDLTCYAPEGALTKEIRDSIVQNKPAILNLLRGYKKLQFQPQPAASYPRNTAGKSEALAQAPGLDLAAEAVLDADIQPPATGDDAVDFTSAKAILLTGASGFLGAYLLHDLMRETDASVYCLVRCTSESDGGQRIRSNLLRYRLWSDDFAARIVPVPGDLALPLLGLGPEKFGTLGSMVDTIYHNGALVNFIYPYSQLKDSNVHGTREVIRFACRSRRKPLHLISTVAIFPPTTDPNAKIFESGTLGSWQGLTHGYGQTKWVAEKVVTIAADRGLPVRIYRPGFVTGDSSTGIWNTDDFIARMIKGCIQLGSIPDSDLVIDIAPVDYVSKAIVHLSRQGELQSNVFHVVNPHLISTREFGRIVSELGYKLALVSYPAWRKALLEDARTSSKNALYPLLMMFIDTPLPERMPVFDSHNTLEGLRGTQIACPKVDINLIATYLKYFSSSGFLDT